MFHTKSFVVSSYTPPCSWGSWGSCEDSRATADVPTRSYLIERTIVNAFDEGFNRTHPFASFRAVPNSLQPLTPSHTLFSLINHDSHHSNICTFFYSVALTMLTRTHLMPHLMLLTCNCNRTVPLTLLRPQNASVALRDHAKTNTSRSVPTPAEVDVMSYTVLSTANFAVPPEYPFASSSNDEVDPAPMQPRRRGMCSHTNTHVHHRKLSHTEPLTPA